MRVPKLRTLLLVALVAAGLVNVHALVLNLRAHARYRDSAFAVVRARVSGIRAAMGQRIALGGGHDRDAALQQALAEGQWESVEVLTPDGASTASAASVAPAPAVAHRLSPKELQSVRGGAVLVGADPSGRGERLLAYALLPGADDQAILRFTAASPALAEDRRERQLVFFGHAATLLVLFLVGGIVMAPRAAPAEEAPPRALVAYEEAMERLRDHGEEQTERYEAERRQLEEVLRDKEALARAGELTAGMVHEVRNGLGTIVGYARLAEASPAEAAESARRIREECETLETIIRRFMDFVRRETLSLGPVDVAAMLQRVVARESRQPGPPVAVQAAAAGSITADEALLERAFENLVRNAREAAGASGHVQVTAAREGPSATVTVSDDGPGFTPGARAALRPFFTTKAGGLGLGLAITLKIVRLHDGDLVLGNRPAGGGAVSIRLPIGGPRTGRAVTEGIVAAAGGLPGPGDASS
jgi:signal transduction histidine kinase